MQAGVDEDPAVQAALLDHIADAERHERRGAGRTASAPAARPAAYRPRGVEKRRQLVTGTGMKL